MHNKYIIIDENKVWTGSANFTFTVLSDQGQKQNDENIIVVSSNNIAQKYTKSFIALRNEIIEVLLGAVAHGDYFLLPEAIQISLRNSLKDSEVKSFIESLIPKYQFNIQNNIFNVFPEMKTGTQKRKASMELPRQISDVQRKKLEEHGFDTRGMSYDQAYSIYGKLLKGIPIQHTVFEDLPSEDESESEEAEEATLAQINYIKTLGGFAKKNLTKSQASSLIQQLKRHK